jgi:hypothetical protein
MNHKNITNIPLVSAIENITMRVLTQQQQKREANLTENKQRTHI